MTCKATQYPVLDLENTGKNINAMRKECKLSIAKIQDACNLSSAQAVYKWCEGRTIPSIDNLIILSAMFGVSMDDIIKTKVVES